MKIIFLILFLPGFSIAEESIAEKRGHIIKVNGVVEIIDKQGDARMASESGVIVREMDTVVTRKGGKVVIRFTDGALSVLDEKSSLRIEKTNWISYLGGKVYFTFRKVFGGSRKVKTKFATIGVRGTTFIITDSEHGGSVALQEGLLEVESPDEVYEIHRQKAKDEFEAFKQQAKDNQAALQEEYTDYKKRVMKEFVEYKKSFMLESNYVVSFEGNRVEEVKMDEDVRAQFDDFEDIAGEMLLEFRQQSKQHREKKEKED